MVNENDFRRIALGMTDAIEGAHMGHPDFRVHDKIFASLRHDRQMAGRGLMVGMVKLTPAQQQHFMQAHPASFSPESGAWGRSGCTRVQLDAVDEDTLGGAITLAWQNTVDKEKTAKKPKILTMKGKTARAKTVNAKRVSAKAARSNAARKPASTRSK
jgi:hypothetical protein